MTTSEQELQAVQTPIHTYTHPWYESQVDLIGMIHIAQAPYYDTIQTIIDTKEAEGAAVHYEKIKQNTPEEHANADPLTIAKASQLRTMMKGIYGILEDLDLGLVKQLDSLTYPEHWQNHDATELDIASRLGSFTVMRHVGLIKLITSGFNLLDGDEERQQKRDILLKALHSATQEESPREKLIKKVLFGSLDDTILDYRNNIALRAYDRQQRVDPKAATVLIWGAGHLKGLGAGLARRGYKKVHEQKLVAIDASVAA